MRLRIFVLLFFSTIFLLLCSSSFAQTSATIRGKLTDPSGAGLPGARVTAVQLDTHAVAARTRSDSDGEFSLTIPAGRYRIVVESDSFTRIEREFVLATGENETWNARMELATASARVVVTDTATPQPAETTPDRVDVITAQDIERSQQIWLTPLLANVPGVSYSRLGPEGGSTTLFLDGGNSNYAKVLIDGVPVNVSEPGLSVDFSNFTVDDIDKVEIVHGAASALYGTDAVSGVVQLFTRRGTTTTPEISVEGDGGTFNTGHGSGRASGLLGLFDYSVGVGYFDTDGQPAPEVDGLNPSDYFRDTTLSGNFGFQISPSDTVRLTIRNDSSDAGQPGQTLYESVPFAVDPGAHTGLHDFSAGLTWSANFGDDWHNQLMGYDSRSQLFEDSPFFDFTVLDKFNRAGLDEQVTYSFPQGGVTVGYLFESETGGVLGRHDQAGYAEWRQQVTRRLTVLAGGRVEGNDSYGTRVVPRAGAAYALRYGRGFWGATRLRASYGQGIKEPPLFPPDCTPILKPEQSATGEAGLDQFLASDRVRLSITYFHNDFHDIVSFDSSGAPSTWNCPAFFGSYFNTDKARAFGADSSIEIKAARWLQIDGVYSYDNSKVLVSPSATDPALLPGNRLLKRPLNSANITINAHFRGVNVNVVGGYVGRRDDSDFLGLGITTNPGYFRLDASLIVPLGHGFSTTAHVENLLDRHYQDSLGYPSLGYNYRAGVRYVWGGPR
jgi:vitamin B12 transporter